MSARTIARAITTYRDPRSDLTTRVIALGHIPRRYLRDEDWKMKHLIDPAVNRQMRELHQRIAHEREGNLSA